MARCCRQGNDGNILFDFGTGGGHGQLTVLDSPCALEFVRQLPDEGALPFQDDDFETVVMVNVNMGGGDDDIDVLVLNPGKVLSQVPYVMVVNKTQNPDSLFTVPLPFLGDEIFPNKIPDGFGPCFVSFPLCKEIKFFQ